MTFIYYMDVSFNQLQKGGDSQYQFFCVCTSITIYDTIYAISLLFDAE